MTKVKYFLMWTGGVLIFFSLNGSRYPFGGTFEAFHLAPLQYTALYMWACGSRRATALGGELLNKLKEHDQQQRQDTQPSGRLNCSL